WTHGLVTKGACLESETTAATLGKEGVRVFNPMSNLDFLSIPIGRYVDDNLKFGTSVKNSPKIFSVNYFLRGKNGEWLNHKNDKAVWLKWMELRVNNEAEAIETPTGFIPLYKDLKQLFKQVLDKNYSEEDYIEQFTVRIPENLSKIDRMVKIFKTRVHDTPNIVFKVLEEQQKRLLEAKEKYGEYIKPDSL
ncbi:MAG: phosphoenolpyruvate carboxykinase (GTP), partial [Thermoplasmatales archaeon]|nr:phosphoenolpyruvate carboxykinase (GTP) [Thermoplasmatales archaeon]